MSRPRFVLGADIGQAHDYTALVLLEHVGDELHVRYIKRLNLGTSYPDQVARIAQLAASPELGQDVVVVVDGTGVGRAVVDILKLALKPLDVPLVSITITGGTTMTRTSRVEWSVPKRDLIGAAQVALQQKRLRIAASLSQAQTLVDELVAYRVKISEDGHDSYGNGRDQPHDDLVLAASIATYAATRSTGARRMMHAGLETGGAEDQPVSPGVDVVVRPMKPADAELGAWAGFGR
jgi:hypothetical protein